MGTVTTICNRKGGCGKSTTALYLIGGLSKLNKRVLLIDIDERQTLTNKMADPDRPTIADVIRGTVTAQEAIQPAKFCDIIPASAALVTPEVLINDRPGREHILKKAIAPIIGKYDFILFDCPGSLNVLTINALTASDNAIIPTIADEDSITGVISMLDIIEDVREYTNPKIKVAGILLTGLNNNTIFGNAMLQNVQNIATKRNVKAFQPIRQTVEIQAAKYTAADVNILDSLKRNPAKAEIESFISDYMKG